MIRITFPSLEDLNKILDALAFLAFAGCVLAFGIGLLVGCQIVGG